MCTTFGGLKWQRQGRAEGNEAPWTSLLAHQYIQQHRQLTLLAIH